MKLQQETEEALRRDISALEEQLQAALDMKREVEQETEDLKMTLSNNQRELAQKDSRIEDLQMNISKLNDQIQQLKEEAEQNPVFIKKFDSEQRK